MRKLRPIGNPGPTAEFFEQIKEAIEQIRGNRRSNVTPLKKQATLAEVRNTLNALLAQIQGDDVATLQEPDPWTTPTLLNSWVRYDNTYAPPGYYKDALGIVHIRGLVKSGAFGSTIFQLPVGYRPMYYSIFANMATNGTTTAACRTTVQTDGSVYAQINEPLGGTASWFCLDHISFLAER